MTKTHPCQVTTFLDSGCAWDSGPCQAGVSDGLGPALWPPALAPWPKVEPTHPEGCLFLSSLCMGRRDTFCNVSVQKGFLFPICTKVAPWQKWPSTCVFFSPDIHNAIDLKSSNQLCELLMRGTRGPGILHQEVPQSSTNPQCFYVLDHSAFWLWAHLPSQTVSSLRARTVSLSALYLQTLTVPGTYSCSVYICWAKTAQCFTVYKALSPMLSHFMPRNTVK